MPIYRNIDLKASGSKFAVSRVAQANAETAAAVATSFVLDEASQIERDDDRRTNEDQQTGEVEATDIDDLGTKGQGTITQVRATPDFLGWGGAFLYGDHAAAAAGGGFLHTSKLVAYPDEAPYFTAVHRKGGASAGYAAAEFLREIGCGLNTETIRLEKEEFLSVAYGVLAIGKRDDGLHTEEIVAAGDGSAPLVLTFDPIGDDHQVVDVWADVDEDGEPEVHVDPTGYVAGTNELAIPDPGGPATDILYVVTYQPKPTEGTFGWTDLSGISPASEFQMRSKSMGLFLGGAYTEPGGVPTFSGGEQANCEIESMTLNFDWRGQASSCWRPGDTVIEYAQQVERGASPVQTIELEARVRHWLLKQKFDRNTPMAVKVDALGPEYEPGQAFYWERIYPRVKVLEKPTRVTNGRIVDAGNLQVLKDAANGWPTVVQRVRNEVATYLS